ncbi:ABC transporter ATP-binding protein [Luteolibacter sp. GHJ8]|jgi:putative ABC transport system ATP-binding protein|uniref:ABC transporter ATP-binding protein n=1 Tax=Luteolibacter rhizosphaerae TaxID=2989719 RepID=A0ABT3G9B1_9BACT|nr:ABC transporter ATP-binding protein [Luteolibacter rhizosphaerae]MCW1916438.1 ABC transporter ATP-binding protein [Luteolibacter rhizosphaerae]
MAPPSDTPPPLVVAAVTKTFDQGNSQVRALDGIDLSVRAGEFVAIMGASGSGKSTLLHAMAGLTDVNSGSIRVDGRDLASFNDAALTRFRRERIGLVFQAFNLIPVLSAEDNVRLPAADQPGLETKIDEVMRRLGIEARRKHKPDALSGGEQQRVAIARALITDPAILLADEPTGSLDSVTGQDLCRLLHELSKNDGRTLCVVTHEPTVAMWADRVVVLKDGRVTAEFATSGSHDPEAISEGYRKALQS